MNGRFVAHCLAVLLLLAALSVLVLAVLLLAVFTVFVSVWFWDDP